MNRQAQHDSLIEISAHARLLSAHSDSQVVVELGQSIKLNASASAYQLGFSDSKFNSDSIVRYRELNEKSNNDTVGRSNLQNVWQELDSACGSLDNALTNIFMMDGVPDEIKDMLQSIDISRIVTIKNRVEEMIETTGGEV